ncbi:hypothetical protein PBI_GAIA_45 [Mycobacterium phage Gaia]|uniref:Uncharacterized protein n=1 Tax=Mycobacterium phage Gaia TaxID=1486472 RepID=A0A068F8N3_9CAUD|nr:hypothetical protein VC46_gp045 [Mycobacterium phage Gaia]AID58865.1 hypothetical protein PBI_GAIA_45 [Mycobacterium phage Gaia]AYQ99989.1 hypothetical protein PBI_NEBKISS_48 [Mycobacterium phage Nebkiss]
MADYPTLREVASKALHAGMFAHKSDCEECSAKMLADTIAAEWHKSRTIENADELAELIDRYGHEVVLLDAHGGACQGSYDFDPDQFPARVLHLPGVDD